MGESAASCLYTPACDHADELFDVTLCILTLEEGREIGDEGAVLLRKRGVGLIDGVGRDGDETKTEDSQQKF